MPIHASVTVTAAATTESTASDPILLNDFPETFNVGFGVEVLGTGEITYTVQHTFEGEVESSGSPVAGGFSAGTLWFDHSTVSGKTASQDGSYAYPVKAVRVQAVSGSGGSVRLTAVQSGV